MQVKENGVEKVRFDNHEILNNLEVDYKGYNPKSMLEVELHPGVFYTTVQIDKGESEMLDPDTIGVNSNKEDPKIIYMPAEINFDRLKKVDNTFKFSPDFFIQQIKA